MGKMQFRVKNLEKITAYNYVAQYALEALAIRLSKINLSAC